MLIPHSVYYGRNIYRSDRPDNRLRWTVFGPADQLAADTLAGIRTLIRYACKPA